MLKILKFIPLITLFFYSFANHKPTFEESMSINKFFKKTLLKKNKHWKLLKDLYNNNFIKQVEEKKLKIPKIIHQIWLGSPFPDKYKDFQQTWIEKHPDWTYILWTDTDIENFELENQIAYNATKNWGEKSDIARYEILYQYGGLYIDTDFECIKPFDNLHYLCNFYAGIGFNKSVVIYNGLIGCTPQHPVMKKCIASIKNNKLENYNVKKIQQRTGPFMLAKIFLQTINDPNANSIIFPSTFFYPLPNNRRKDNPETFARWIKPESMAIHYWEVSWIK